MPQIPAHRSQPPLRVRPRVPESERKRVAKACRRCRFRKNRCIVAEKEADSVPKACQRCIAANAECVFDALHSDSPLPSRGQDRNDNVVSSPSSLCASTAGASPNSARLLIRNPHQTHFVSEVSNGTFLAQVTDAVTAESPKDVDLSYVNSYQTQSHDFSLIQAAKQGLPPRNVTKFLVDVFFHTVEANYYYMDREGFRAKLAACYDRSDESQSDPSFLCLALMVLAMGSQFADLQSPKRTSPPGPSSDNGPGMVFYLKAKLLLSDVVTQCSLESIQACFLMGLFLLPSNISDLSYVYHGMALKMAISAGLHRSISEAGLDQRVMHVRNRLWWSLYTSERRLTIILDHPKSIHEEDIDAPLPEPSPDLDFPQSEDNIANLLASIALTRIFNNAVRIAKATGFQHDTQENAVYEIRKNLDDWADGLPQRLKLDNLSPDMKSFRGAVHLHMNHSQILIYMGRLSLLRRLQKHLKDQSSGIQAEELSDSEASLIRDCVSAAFKIIQLINYLHENGRLARFSFTDLNCCSIAALIIMIHELIQQHPLYRSSMETVMRAMTHMATGCSNAKQGLKLIKDLERVTALLKSKMTRNREKDCVADNATGYDEWENWVASKGEIVQSSSGVLTSPDAESLQSHLDLGQPSELNGHTGEAIESEAYVSYDFLDDQHGGDGMQSAFYSVWPDNLGSLGLSVFEDFTFPS